MVTKHMFRFAYRSDMGGAIAIFKCEGCGITGVAWADALGLRHPASYFLESTPYCDRHLINDHPVVSVTV